MDSLPHRNSQDTRDCDPELVASAALTFGRFESAYMGDLEAAQGKPAINALFCVYAAIGEIVKSGRMSPDLNEVIRAMEGAFRKTEKAD